MKATELEAVTAPPLNGDPWSNICRSPFVMIDFGGSAQLFTGGRIVRADRIEQISGALDSLRRSDCSGFIAYEAGYAFEPRLNRLFATELATPLLWFMVGAAAEKPPPLPHPDGAWAGQPQPRIGEAEYAAAVRKLLEHIRAGDIYQANFTFLSEIRVVGHPLALYAQIKSRAAAPWSAIVYTGDTWLLSFSPELFFTSVGGVVTARPMKGTAAIGSDPKVLREDAKQRAENLMIVDLIRNDLSRVSRPGSVKVPELFTVEHYPTVLQMTSTVTGTLKSGIDNVDILKAMFPCGSITGAPKIRAMEVIADTESSRRGPYTGSIGRLGKDGSAAFNVAIRTLVMSDESHLAELGLGSGIVADSIIAEEWEECGRKGAFVASDKTFTLIETMRVDGGAVQHLDLHLDRLRHSAAQFEFRFEGDQVRSDLIERAAALGQARVRLELWPDGAINLTDSPIPTSPAAASVTIVDRPVHRRDFRLRHKTSDRSFYDEPRVRSGAFEIIFIDSEGYLTEGSFSNIFVERAGKLITPPLGRGLLPGVLREFLLANGTAIEADLREADIAGGFYIGNALRGLIPAHLMSTGHSPS